MEQGKKKSKNIRHNRDRSRGTEVRRSKRRCRAREKRTEINARLKEKARDVEVIVSCGYEWDSEPTKWGSTQKKCQCAMQRPFCAKMDRPRAASANTAVEMSERPKERKTRPRREQGAGKEIGEELLILVLMFVAFRVPCDEQLAVRSAKRSQEAAQLMLVPTRLCEQQNSTERNLDVSLIASRWGARLHRASKYSLQV